MILHMQRKKLNQSGMVSIIVTMIMMVIMSLVILGFARVSRREMRQGLDRQLASQANYAAETGIDDARNYLADPSNSLSGSAGTQCNTYAAGGLPGLETVGINSVVTSCVLVTGAVNDLVYDSVGTDEEVLFPIRMESGNVSSFVIEWQDPGVATPDFSQCEPDPSGIVDHMPRLADWQCPTAMLRVDMVPIGPGNVSRNDLVSGSRGFVLLPSRTLQASSSPVNVADGRIYRGLCQTSASPRCRSAVISVSGSYGASQPAMYVRIRPLYRTAQLRISANSGQAMIGAQAVIDSTGRANDVLKRLVVRVPTCPSGIACGKRPANSALQLAETLCKQYGVIPAPTSTINVESGDAACQLP